MDASAVLRVYVYSRVGPYLRVLLINRHIGAAAFTTRVLIKCGETEDSLAFSQM